MVLESEEFGLKVSVKTNKTQQGIFDIIERNCSIVSLATKDFVSD
jgi:hypothetical protein